MNQLTFSGMENTGELPPQSDVAPKRKTSSKVVTLPGPKRFTAEVLPPAPKRVPIAPPVGISKSMAKAIGCASYFAGQYLQPETIGYSEHYLLKVGIEIHKWRQSYVEHLICINKSQDLEWREWYLATEHLSEDARCMIQHDDFAVNPEDVYGPEIFMSIDKDFKKLELLTDQKPGALSSNPNFLCSGTIDLLFLLNNGRKARIQDFKSGFSTVGVTDEEPAIYAALVMIHFPKVEEVEFVWDFLRVDAIKRTSYTQADLPWIKEMIVSFYERAVDYVNKWNRSQPLPANPLSGLCPYCQVTCPMRPRWDSGELAIGPVQTLEDFRRLALLKKVCDDVSQRAGQAMLSYMDANGAVQDLGNGWEAAATSYSSFEYPLHEALQVLGLKVVNDDGETPAYTPAYDVPIASLTVSGLSNYAKTKKSQKRPGGGGVSREGLKDNLVAIADRSSATRLKIRKSATQDLTEQLEASISQLQPSGT